MEWPYNYGVKILCKMQPSHSVCRESMLEKNSHCFQRSLPLPWGLPQALWRRICGNQLPVDLSRPECRAMMEMLQQSAVSNLDKEAEDTHSLAKFLFICFGTVSSILTIYMIRKIAQRIRHTPDH